MKKLLFGVALLASMSSFATSSECHFEAGKYTQEVTLKVTLGSNPLIGEEDLYGKCEVIDFTKELADQILESKVSTIESFYGHEAAIKVRPIYSKQLASAAGGKFVNCQDSPVSNLGVIVNGEKSFIVLNGGNAYFDMTNGTCI